MAMSNQGPFRRLSATSGMSDPSSETITVDEAKMLFAQVGIQVPDSVTTKAQFIAAVESVANGGQPNEAEQQVRSLSLRMRREGVPGVVVDSMQTPMMQLPTRAARERYAESVKNAYDANLKARARQFALGR